MSSLIFLRNSRTVAFNRLPVMRTPGATRSRPSSVTTSQLATVQRLWSIAGLPPTSGYEAVGLAVLLATAPTLVDMVSLIDFDDAVAVVEAVDAVLRWRGDVEQVFCRRPSCHPRADEARNIQAGVAPASCLQASLKQNDMATLSR